VFVGVWAAGLDWVVVVWDVVVRCCLMVEPVVVFCLMLEFVLEPESVVAVEFVDSEVVDSEAASAEPVLAVSAATQSA
jgi:hypothetical protein